MFVSVVSLQETERQRQLESLVVIAVEENASLLEEIQSLVLLLVAFSSVLSDIPPALIRLGREFLYGVTTLEGACLLGGLVFLSLHVGLFDEVLIAYHPIERHLLNVFASALLLQTADRRYHEGLVHGWDAVCD